MAKAVKTRKLGKKPALARKAKPVAKKTVAAKPRRAEAKSPRHAVVRRKSASRATTAVVQPTPIPEMPATAMAVSHGIAPINYKLNPWFSIWIKPRATMQQLLTDANADKMVPWLVAVSGILYATDRASGKNAGDYISLPILLGMILFLGVISGFVNLYLTSFLLAWTGRWIKGQAQYREIQKAFAWGHVPFVWSGILTVVMLLLLGREMFVSQTPLLDSSFGLLVATFAIGILQLVIGVWFLVVLCKCLGQVQGFSAWKALLNVVMAYGALLVPILIVAGLTVLIMRLWQ